MYHKNISAYILRTAKKIKLINDYGGKCEHCGENRFWLLTFHHLKNKKCNVMNLINGRFSNVQKEAKKCILLCHNCHREEHFKVDGEDKQRTLNKQLFLEYKNVFKCETCGYDKCIKTFDFHHINPKEKELSLGRIINKSKYKDISSIETCIKFELDKSSVLCSNCHQNIHFDNHKFESYKNQIYDKSMNLNELRIPLDKNKIIDLYNSGKTVTEIADIFSTGKSTICTITRKYGLGKSYAERGIWKDEALKLYKEGKNGYQISKLIKINKGMVYNFINEYGHS